MCACEYAVSTALQGPLEVLPSRQDPSTALFWDLLPALNTHGRTSTCGLTCAHAPAGLPRSLRCLPALPERRPSQTRPARNLEEGQGGCAPAAQQQGPRHATGIRQWRTSSTATAHVMERSGTAARHGIPMCCSIPVAAACSPLNTLQQRSSTAACSRCTIAMWEQLPWPLKPSQPSPAPLPALEGPLPAQHSRCVRLLSQAPVPWVASAVKGEESAGARVNRPRSHPSPAHKLLSWCWQHAGQGPSSPPGNSTTRGSGPHLPPGRLRCRAPGAQHAPCVHADTFCWRHGACVQVLCVQSCRPPIPCAPKALHMRACAARPTSTARACTCCAQSSSKVGMGAHAS